VGDHVGCWGDELQINISVRQALNSGIDVAEPSVDWAIAQKYLRAVLSLLNPESAFTGEF
jgi:hypothetical protein